MPKTGTTVTIRWTNRNPDTGVLEDAGVGTMTLLLIKPDGTEVTVAQGEVAKDSTGTYHKAVLGDMSGLWHYRILINGSAADEGSFPMESEFDAEFTESEQPDLTDLRVMLPRARRKVEGPWGSPAGRPPLLDSVLYNMIGDAVAEVVMLSGSFFHHQLLVKARDPLGGYPVAWRTDTALEEYETTIVCAQVALNYYFHLFRDMKISETIQNEGTQWTYELSANVIRNYLESLRDERDRAVEGLRINLPVLDRYASNIRVRDQQTVAVLEWWAGAYDTGGAGGLPGGQEAAVVPTFFPPGNPFP